MIVHKTEEGKELELVTAPRSAAKIYRWIGGGELPRVLTGEFTGDIPAKNALNRYLKPKNNPAPTFSPESTTKEDKPEEEFISQLIGS